MEKRHQPLSGVAEPSKYRADNLRKDWSHWESMQKKGISGLQFQNGLEKDMRPWQGTSDRRKGKGKGNAKSIEPSDDEDDVGEDEDDEEGRDVTGENGDQNGEDDEDEEDGNESESRSVKFAKGNESAVLGDSRGLSSDDNLTHLPLQDSDDQVEATLLRDDEANGRSPSPRSIVLEGNGGNAPKTPQSPGPLPTALPGSYGPSLVIDSDSSDSPALNDGNLDDRIKYLKGLSQDDTYQQLVDAFVNTGGVRLP